MVKLHLKTIYMPLAMIGAIHYGFQVHDSQVTLIIIIMVIIQDIVNSRVILNLKTDGLNLLMKEKMLLFYQVGPHKLRFMIGFK